MKAIYKLMVGEKKRNHLIRRAGLGLTGAFQPMKYEITWDDGIDVSRERAIAAGETLMKGINELEDTECNSVELLSLS